jgi:AAHS family benzoate transporter-like MFS transporter
VILGFVVAMNLPLQQNFLLMAVPAAIGFMAVLLINRKSRNRGACASHGNLPHGPAPAGATAAALSEH